MFSLVSRQVFNTQSFIQGTASYLARLQNGFGFRDFPGRLVGDLLPGVSVEHPEEVVVGAGHDGRVVAVPTALELVENAVVLVERAEFRTEILVDLESNHPYR